MQLTGKTAIVTGGGRGIGREIALKLAGEGADIVICDVMAEAMKDTEKDIVALGRQSLSCVVDVTDFRQVEDMVNKTIDKFSKIDILINNAGITKDGLIIRMKESDWDAVINVNLKGVFNCIKAVSKVMMKQRSGNIVNMASIIGIMGNAGQANYAASKAGVIALTKSTAKELASRNIRVNAIAPGFIQTKMTDKLSDDLKNKMLEQIPLKRFGSPEDIANLALFFSSSQSAYITGQVLVIDGGMVM